MDVKFDIMADYERQEVADAHLLDRITRQVTDIEALGGGWLGDRFSSRDGDSSGSDDETRSVRQDGGFKKKRQVRVIDKGYKYDILNDEEDTTCLSRKCYIRESTQAETDLDVSDNDDEFRFEAEGFHNDLELFEELGVVLETAVSIEHQPSIESPEPPGPVERLRGDEGLDDEDGHLLDEMMTDARRFITTARRDKEIMMMNDYEDAQTERQEDNSGRDSINTLRIQSPMPDCK